VHARHFEIAADGTPGAPEAGERLVSAGARGPIRWRRDGRELYFVSTDGKLMAVDITTTPAIVVGAPKAIFTFPEPYLRANIAAASIGATTGVTDVVPDGSRWITAMPPADAPTPAHHVLVNWRAGGK
jgi:hypothetical protein